MRQVALALALLAGACTSASAVQPAPADDPRVADLAEQVRTLTAQRDAALSQQLAAAVSAAENQPLVIWNTPQTIPAGRALSLGLPDTFTVRVQFTATAPVRAQIMTFDQFVQWMNTGTTNGLTYAATTSLDVTFHDAEGCGIYLLVLDAGREAIVSPNVVIQRTQRPGATGACAN